MSTTLAVEKVKQFSRKWPMPGDDSEKKTIFEQAMDEYHKGEAVTLDFSKITSPKEFQQFIIQQAKCIK